MHTEVVYVVDSWALRTQSSTRSSCTRARVPTPPGNTTMSGLGISSNVASMVTPRMPFSLRTSPRSWPMKVMSIDGNALQHFIRADGVERREAREEGDRDLHG